MKTSKFFLRSALVLSAVLLWGCPNEGPYHLYTRINPDGSCYREFIRTADSAFVIHGDTSKNPFPMKLDSTWKLTYYQRWSGDTSHFAGWPAGKVYKVDSAEFSWFVTAVKKYPSVEEMANTFRFDDSKWESVKPEIAFHKKFRWFYTFFEYSETYPSTNIFKMVPVSQYLDEKQIAALYGEDRKLFRGMNGMEMLSELQDLNKKAEKWMEHNLFEEMYRIYLDNYDRFVDPPVDSQTFAMEKDTIYKYYLSTDSAEFDDLDEILNQHYHTGAYNLNEDITDTVPSSLANYMELSEVSLNSKISMPGKIIETNAPFLNSDTLSWKVDSDRFLLNNFTLSAHSRKPNFWAFAVTGFVILAAVTGLFVRRK